MALQKNKREICKDKQILMISRFYKPAFVTIFYFLLAYYKRKRRENARKILFNFWKNRKYNNHKRVASKRKSSLPATRFFLVKIIYLP